MEYDNLIKMVLTELTERSLKQYREENIEYAALVKKRAVLSVQVFSDTDGLEEPKRQLLTEYYDVIGGIHSAEIERIYLQGVKDCIRFLRGFEVI